MAKRKRIKIEEPGVYEKVEEGSKKEGGESFQGARRFKKGSPESQLLVAKITGKKGKVKKGKGKKSKAEVRAFMAKIRGMKGKGKKGKAKGKKKKAAEEKEWGSY